MGLCRGSGKGDAASDPSSMMEVVGGLDPGCILKVEPMGFAHELMWWERRGEEAAWEMTVRLLGSTLHCVFPSTHASPTGVGAPQGNVHRARVFAECLSHEVSLSSFPEPSFCCRGLRGKDRSSCSSCPRSLQRDSYPSTSGTYIYETTDLNNQTRQRICSWSRGPQVAPLCPLNLFPDRYSALGR